MKKVILLLTTLFLINCFAFSSKVKDAYAIGIFDKKGNGENVQHTRITKSDYNGTCYTKVFVIGKIFKLKPQVTIGNAIGHFQSTKAVYNKSKIKIGEVMTFKHYKVSKGYIKVKLKEKILDTKVFVK